MHCSFQRTIARWTALTAVVAAAAGVLPVRVTGQAPPAPTFSRDVAPILQRSCQNCHRQGGAAPMSLMTYEEMRPWARSIKHRTSLRSKPDVMPPWYIDKTVGIQHYKDDMSLSAQEIATIGKWVDAGAPHGNPADMPPPVDFGDANAWRLGQPDVIISSPSVEVAAVQPDWWGSIGVTPTGLTEDRYVKSVEIKEITESIEEAAGTRTTVGGTIVIHHLAYVIMDKDGRPVRDTAQWPVHEVGRNPDMFDPDAGRLLPAGSKISFFSAHLHANGRKTKARLDIGLRFHAKGYKPTLKYTYLRVTSPDIDVRGGEADQRLESFLVLKENTKIMIFEPHLHAAGVGQCLEAIWDNTRETLTCAGYNHSWVRVYSYADNAQPLLPKGTILRVTSFFDSTPANRNLADPRNWSGLGNRSIDNMATAIVTGMELSDEDFQKEMAKRRQALKLTSGQSVIGCPLCGYERSGNPNQQRYVPTVGADQ